MQKKAIKFRTVFVKLFYESDGVIKVEEAILLCNNPQPCGLYRDEIVFDEGLVFLSWGEKILNFVSHTRVVVYCRPTLLPSKEFRKI